MKLKWLTTLVILLALTGSVWAGVCGCFSEQQKSHSCCKKDKSVGDYMSAKTCCSADCETVISAASKTPQKQNSDNSHLKAPFEAAEGAEAFKVEWLSRVFRAEAPRPKARTGDNRLRFARGPDLYLRHNSFLI
jgi:hypothetical protein